MAKRRYTADEIVTVLRQVEVSMANGKDTPRLHEFLRGLYHQTIVHPMLAAGKVDAELIASHTTS